MKEIPKDIIRILSTTCLSDLNDEDSARLQKWLAEDRDNQRVYDYLKEKGRLSQDLSMLDRFDLDEAWHKQESRLEGGLQNHVAINWKLWGTAVAAMLVIVGSFFFYIRTPNVKLQDTPIAAIQPGGNQATIILSDGRAIALKEDAEGVYRLIWRHSGAS